MISNTSKYALRAVIYLAQNEKENLRTGIKKISDDLDIPSPFLSKILQTLAKKKILLSTKGPNGGFAINKKSGEITIMDIIEVIDGLDFFNNCLLGLDCHENEKDDYRCPIHEKYDPIKEQMRSFFENQTIGELAENMKKSDHLLKI